MTATLHGEYPLLNGQPAKGRIRVKVDTDDQAVRDATGNVVWQGPLLVTLIDGEVSISVPGTDVGTYSPTGFTYTVVEELEHVAPEDWREVSFAAPDGTTVELADIPSDTESTTPDYAAAFRSLQEQIDNLEGGGVSSVNGETGIVVLDAGDVGAQPADSDLTAIAALTTTAFGRAFLALANAAAGRTALELGTAATHAHGDYDPAGSAAAAQTAAATDATNKVAAEAAARATAIATAVANLINSAPGALDTLNELAAALGDDPNFATTITTALAGKQPLDADLTAIAALTTTAYGRGFLELANAAAGRTALGLGTAAVAATGDFDPAGSAAAAQAASQPVDSDLTAIAALSTTAYGRAFLALADAAAGRTALGLGSAAVESAAAFDVAGAAAAAQAASQPLDADLTAIAALATAAYGRSLLTSADAAAARTLLGLATTGVIESTSTDVTLVNSTSAAALASFTVPAGLAAAGDVFILECGGDYLNNSGAASNLTVRVVVGSTTLASNAQSIGAGGATRRKWVARVVVSAATLSAQDVDLQAAVSGVAAGAFSSHSLSWWGHDVAAEGLSGAWAYKFEAIHGTAASTIDIVCKYARLTRIPKVTV